MIILVMELLLEMVMILYIRNGFINNNAYSNFPRSYQDNLGKGKSIFTGEISNNSGEIKVKEIEAFKVFN